MGILSFFFGELFRAPSPAPDPKPKSKKEAPKGDASKKPARKKKPSNG